MPNELDSTDLTDAHWALIVPQVSVARTGGRPSTTDIRGALNAIFYLCAPVANGVCFPAWGTVCHYFWTWKDTGVWTCVRRAVYEQARSKRGGLRVHQSS